MRIDAGQHMRMDQRMKLAPRMIQSMEILQMPSMALEERIEQELASNPTLELREPGADAQELEEERVQAERDDREGERELVVSDNTAGSDRTNTDDFERLTNISEEYGESWESNAYEGESHRAVRNDGERDRKLDAIANTAARAASLTDQLLDQWRMVEASPEMIRTGEYLIGFIDDDGYIRTDRQTIVDQAPAGVAVERLDTAWELVKRTLEPVGLGARDLRECLLLQIDAKARQLAQDRHAQRQGVTGGDGELGGAGGNGTRGVHTDLAGGGSAPDFAVERLLVSEYLKDIEANRLPRIAKSTGLSLERIKAGIAGLRQFHPHPGRLLISESPRAITPDAIVEFDDDQDRYVARLFNGRLPNVQINPNYVKMARDQAVDRKTRDFVGNNLRSARWLLDAIQQRQHTLLRVINVVLEAQRDFFDQGPQALKPLPMTQVADQLGIHVATVSRAVSEKYIQTPRGIFPLRMFFSGGTETDAGDAMSWAAVQAKLSEIIGQEDKSNPLSDDALVEKLKEHGIDIARRTIAKYRKQLHIATARQRRQF